MAAGAHRLPPRRSGIRLWSMRFLGLLATAALLGVGAAAALMVIPDGDSSEVAVPEPPPAAQSKPATDKKKKPAKPKYTPAERRARTAAVGVLREQGYRPVTLSDYAPDHVLRVLIGKGDGGQRAFFFAGTRYIGNDAAEDSDSIKVVRAGNRSVALSYKVSSGGRERVLFRWDGRDLAPQTAIPPAIERNAPAG